MIITVETEIDLDDFLEECKITLEENNYTIIGNDENEIYYNLEQYIEQMGKNLMYLDDRDTKKTYAEIYEDLDKILRGF